MKSNLAFLETNWLFFTNLPLNITHKNVETDLKSIICWLFTDKNLLLTSKNWVNMHISKSILTLFWKKPLRKFNHCIVVKNLRQCCSTSLLYFTSFWGALIWSEGHSYVAQTRSLFFLSNLLALLCHHKADSRGQNIVYVLSAAYISKPELLPLSCRASVCNSWGLWS